MSDGEIVTGIDGGVAITAAAATYIPLLILGDGGRELVRLEQDGTVRWMGRVVDGDGDFRLAMVALAERLVPPNLSASNRLAMAAEYEDWIAYFHAGTGDYNDFLRQRLQTLRNLGDAAA